LPRERRREEVLWFALVFALGAAGCTKPQRDVVAGELVTFNDNGAWSWFQDERALVDRERDLLLVASIPSGDGPGSAGRRGGVEVVSYDLSTREKKRHVLDHVGDDERNAPAILLRPDGRYLVMYANNNADKLSRYRVSKEPHDPGEWTKRQTFDWSAVGCDSNVTYANLVYLAAEDRTYNFARACFKSPNLLVSEDRGETWSYGGLLLTGKRKARVNAYVKLSSNGIDRIDFVATERHPSDFETSLYHGYIEGGQLYRTDGSMVDDDLFDEESPEPSAFTPVFKTGSEVSGVKLTHAWPADFHANASGLHAVLTARVNGNAEDHRFVYATLENGEWRLSLLAKAGGPLIKGEKDYTGLAAIDPDRPGEVYVSTPIDPRSGEATAHYELYKGVTRDAGKSWAWSAVTTGSTMDNVRPIVPAWGEGTAVIWMRGRLSGPQAYRTSVVGIIERR
jgi:hypothetical protein